MGLERVLTSVSPTASSGRYTELSSLLELVKGILLDHVAEADASNAARQSGQRNGAISHSQAAALLPPEIVSQRLSLNLTDKPQGKDGLLELTDRILRLSINTWDHGFMHKLYSGTNPVGVISELILAILNTNSHVYTVSPALSVIEKQTGRALANMFGLRETYSGGITQPGGSASNFNSVLIARHQAMPFIKETGISGQQLVMFTSVDSHYSLEKAAQMSGIGSQGVCKIPTDAEGRMSVPALRRSILDASDQGKHPFYVNATAGTTVRGAYDPIDEIADVCQEFGLWLHVDGSLGGSAIFTRRQSWRLKGSERADSITINPHKMLSVPISCSFLLGRDLRQFRSSNSIDAGYLFHEDAPLAAATNDADDTYDLAEFTPQCGRKGDALKLALGWVYYGRIGYERYVDNAFDMAAYLAALIKNHPRMEIAAVPQSVQVCFYYMPSRMTDKHDMAAKHNTAITAYISEGLPSKGFMVDYAPGPVGKFLRVVTNGTTTKETLNSMVNEIDEIGQSFIK
ncbi:putative glutamate decarboxylase [Lindgomyces ingoldianus]|uniref:Glutamate decarboxylase n=1 Tax=Lindgomyces ingoldianus TaxID=673940 RepID=A0ACB6QC73_9PLEO|nr:putative glutamate decarboxylase [Lindgomyces ingoldianus]KAF2463977.1 putative glutamate decarboxylase [Lindgomyces ingoldianus]